MSAEVSYVVANLQRLSGPLWCGLILSCVMMTPGASLGALAFPTRDFTKGGIIPGHMYFKLHR